MFKVCLAGLAWAAMAAAQASVGLAAEPHPPSPTGGVTGIGTMFYCEFSDGRKGFSAQDLSRDFPQTVRTCVAQRLVVPDPPARQPAAFDVAAYQPQATRPSSRRASGARALPAEVELLVRASGNKHGVDPHLVAAVVHVESRGQPRARSPKGALGLMQVMPATGQRYGVPSASQLLEPAVNVDAGVRYLKDLLHMFGGQTHLALAAYNAGEGAVMRYGQRIPPYPETQSYVRQVLLRYQLLGGP